MLNTLNWAYNTAYNAIYPEPTLWQKVSTDIDFLIDHSQPSASNELTQSLKRMSRDLGNNGFHFFKLRVNMLKNASHFESALAVCALLLKRDMSDLNEADQLFRKIIADKRSNFQEEVTDEKLETIKLNLDNFKYNALAKAYQFIMVSLQELNSNPWVWQGKLDTLIQSDRCYSDLQKILLTTKHYWRHSTGAKKTMTDRFFYSL